MAQNDGQARLTQIAGYVVGVGFFVLAGIFLAMSPSVEIPQSEQTLVGASEIQPGARREILADPPMISIGTLNQRCSDCHSLFNNVREEGRDLQQHKHVQLNHGMNDGCLNCHDTDDREKLTLRGGETVDFGHVEQLCAQCHGPIYRDWGRGTHGKTIGYWDSDLGESVKLTCTQCHDPHSPAYEPMAPLPGPNTLRMGDQQSHHGDLINDRNPLQRWRLLEQADTDATEHGDEDK